MHQQVIGRSIEFILRKTGSDNQWSNGTESHDNELFKFTTRFEESGNEGIKMAVHEKVVNGDSFHRVQRMQSQYIRLEKGNQKSFSLSDFIVIVGTDCFTSSRPLEYQRSQLGEPWAVRTSLDWTVSGPLSKNFVSTLTFYHCSLNQSAGVDSNKPINSLWDKESHGSWVKKNSRSP